MPKPGDIVWKVYHEEDDGEHMNPEYYADYRRAVDVLEVRATNIKGFSSVTQRTSSDGSYYYRVDGRCGYYEEIGVAAVVLK